MKITSSDTFPRRRTRATMLAVWTATRPTTPKSRITCSSAMEIQTLLRMPRDRQGRLPRSRITIADEGLIQCSDCHNVHGTTTHRQVRAMPTGDAICAKCHADKLGPFVYEHVPVKTEGCSSCHTPHGSTNQRFLRVNQVNLLCLQCHSFPVQGPAGPSHNQSTKYQACTMCHAAIHGSNASNVFFR